MGNERISTRPLMLVPGDGVLLLHGLGANRWIMRPLEKRLLKLGCRTLNWRYPSTRRSIATHAMRLVELLEELTAERSEFLAPGHRLHLVTHSMGCIVTRLALAQRSFPRLGRWVMLAPPNHGSPVARILSHFLGRVVPPLAELSDEPDSLVNQLPDFRPNNPIAFGVIQAQRDRVIPAASVSLAGQADHVIVDSHHGLLPWHERTGRLVERFLHSGFFAN